MSTRKEVITSGARRRAEIKIQEDEVITSGARRRAEITRHEDEVIRCHFRTDNTKTKAGISEEE